MNTTPLPNEKLSSWYFTVQHCKYILQERIRVAEADGFDPQYDKQHLERLEELDMFLKMSWDAYMDDLLDRASFNFSALQAREGSSDG